MNAAALRQTLAVRWTRLRPFSRRVRQLLPAHLELVQEATAELDASMHEIEARFLKVSHTLETTTTIGRDVVEHGEALIALALGQGGGEIMIDAAAQHIWHAIEFVEHNGQRTAQLTAQLTTANEQITQTLRAERTLERTIAPLTYIQTMFRVESSGLPHEVQEMFHTLGREIDRIRLRVEQGFHEKFQLVREIQAILDRATTLLVAEQERARQSVAALRQHMTASLAAMKASYEKNRDRDTRLISASQGITAATGKVVMALQVQDILSQKFQHTHTVLTEMDANFSRLPSDRRGACQSLRFLQQSGQIAHAQLGAMHDELARAGQTIGGGLHEIIQLMATLDADCLALRDLDTVTTGVDGAVQILLDSLAAVRQLVRTASAHAIAAHQTIEPIGGMTTNFTSFMRELSLEIQIIGLNAEVQAAHVGRGTGLEVLSAHTSAISRETSRVSHELAVQLDGLTAGLDQVVASFREIRDANNTYSVTLDSDIASHDARIHGYRDSARKILVHIAAQLPKLTSETQSASEQSDFSAVAAAEIAELQTALAGLTAAAKQTADESGITVTTQGLTDQFLGSYTMRSQLETHRAALGEPATPAGDTVAPAASTDIELFGSDAPPPLAAPAFAAGSANGVDLGDEAPVAVPATTPTAAAGVDLWDEPAAATSSAPEGSGTGQFAA